MPEFLEYQAQVKKNCAHLALSLKTKGYTLVSGKYSSLLVGFSPPFLQSCSGTNKTKVERTTICFCWI